MPNQVTVNAAALVKTGPDRLVAGAATPAILLSVSRVDFDFNGRRLQVYQDGLGGNVKEFDLVTVATVTIVKTGSDWAVTLA